MNCSPKGNKSKKIGWRGEEEDGYNVRDERGGEGDFRGIMEGAMQGESEGGKGVRGDEGGEGDGGRKRGRQSQIEREVEAEAKHGSWRVVKGSDDDQDEDEGEDEGEGEGEVSFIQADDSIEDDIEEEEEEEEEYSPSHVSSANGHGSSVLTIKEQEVSDMLTLSLSVRTAYCSSACAEEISFLISVNRIHVLRIVCVVISCSYFSISSLRSYCVPPLIYTVLCTSSHLHCTVYLLSSTLYCVPPLIYTVLCTSSHLHCTVYLIATLYSTKLRDTTLCYIYNTFYYLLQYESMIGSLKGEIRQLQLDHILLEKKSM
jgi:hypothetical protein